VFIEKVVLEAASKHIATNDELASFEALEWSEIPEFILIKGGHVDTAGHKDAL